MSLPLKVLLVEDAPVDAELIVRHLQRSGFTPAVVRVETEADYLEALQSRPEIVLSDYALPQFSGLRALSLLRSSGFDIPLVLVSGTIGDEIGVEAMRLGAADFLLKDRLARLGSAVSRALEANRLHTGTRQAMAEIERSERQLRVVFDGIAGFVGLFSVDRKILELNRSSLDVAGVTREQVLGTPFESGPWWTHSTDMQRRLMEALNRAASGQSASCELTAITKEGMILSIDGVFNPLVDREGVVVGVIGSGVDVTARKEGERKIRDQLVELTRWQEVMFDREDRVMELKAEVNALRSRLNESERYDSPPA